VNSAAYALRTTVQSIREALVLLGRDTVRRWASLWALAGLGLVLFALLLWRARRGAILRALSYALILLAIANPHLKQEEREPLNDVVAVVVDDTQSQAIAGRDPRTEAIRKDLEERLKTFPNLDVRWIHSASTSGDGDRDGTMLFTDLAKGLADVPPDRLAGVIMLTDGNVHDVPGNAAALGFDAPVHALLTVLSATASQMWIAPSVAWCFEAGGRA